jgi:hypothetical protein
MLGDFLEGQEAVAFFAVVDEAGLQRRLHPRDHGLVDVALALFAPFDFGFEVEELLSIDDGQAPLFRLRGIDQHAFHVHSVRAGPVQHHGPAVPQHRCTKKRAEPLARNALDCAAPREGASARSVGACVRVARLRHAGLPTRPRIARPCCRPGRAGKLPGPRGAVKGERTTWAATACRTRCQDGAQCRAWHLEFSVLRVSEAGFSCDSLPPAHAAPPGHLGTTARHAPCRRCITSCARTAPCALTPRYNPKCPGKLR